MSKHKVVHFEIPISDFKKAKDFYGKVFDWKLEDWQGEYLMATTTEVNEDGMTTEPGGINGGFYIRKKKSDQPSIVVETDSIEETLKAAKEAGGKITREKSPVGDMGFMGEFIDNDGNEISLWQNTKKAEL